MNVQDTNPGSSAQLDNLSRRETQFTPPPIRDPQLKEFIGRYCDPVYTCIARLTGLSDLDVLEYITGEVILELWNNRDALSQDQSPGIFVFKTLLTHALCYLKSQNNADRIGFLRDTLLIDPACYLHIIDPGKGPLKVKPHSYLLHKIKRIWKTF
jgi:hypothetical protein